MIAVKLLMPSGLVWLVVLSALAWAVCIAAVWLLYRIAVTIGALSAWSGWR